MALSRGLAGRYECLTLHFFQDGVISYLTKRQDRRMKQPRKGLNWPTPMNRPLDAFEAVAYRRFEMWAFRVIR